MQREIKFRAWNKTKKKMVQPFAYIGPRGNLITVFTIPGNTYKPMQYTGLKDKKGKEIYEGDIVKCFDDLGENPNLFKVEYAEAHFVLSPLSELMDGRNFFTGSWYLGTKEFEGIGNIYENPELLKSK